MGWKFDYKKQKLRGWKRRLKDVDYWIMDNEVLDLDELEQKSIYYAKLWSCPFCSLRKYTLPNWYKRLIVHALIDVYLSWKKRLEELDEPYYLKIWIFKNDFMQSQVVASYRESLHNYDTLFSEVESSAALPAELKIEASTQLTWDEGIFLTQWSKQEMFEDVKNKLWSLKDVNKIINSAYLIEENSEDTIYQIIDDVVWLSE
ncbi:hypothetical protein [Enterococcus sp. AZ072]|uniref:hypothetical protein n=1 Tax=unclassified Enterococcus TaxID=2608891 RepID=UPI003D27A342